LLDSLAQTAVIIVGLPFPAVKDPQVILKREFNDSQRKQGRTDILAGSKWYTLQAYRALNQAVGRAIRHRWDYGAIILADDRLAKAGVADNLPKWIRSSLSPYVSF
jgi:Rad3-related DNA helicase